jgi:hypothetical protein
VTLEVTAPEGVLRDALRSVPGVVDVTIARGSQHDDQPLTVQCRVDGEDGVEATIARTVASRFALHRLERHEPTLENVFLSYVGEPGVENRSAGAVSVSA